MRKWVSLIAGLLLWGEIVTGVTLRPHLRGYTLTEAYTFEDAVAESHLQLFQTLSFRVEDLGTKGLSVVSHLRYQGDAVDDFAESGALKVHNLYLRYQKAKVDLRLGRQFLAEGVGFGTYDVARVKYAIQPKFFLTLWGGLAAPPDRKAELQGMDKAPAMGASLRHQLSTKARLTWSYLREERQGELFRHRAGVSTNVQILPQLSGLALLHTNLEGPTGIDRLRFLLRYYPNSDLRLYGEFASSAPQLPPDSPFEVLEIPSSQLVRFGGTHRVWENYWFGLRLQSLISAPDPNSTIGLSVEGPWGMFGYRLRFGSFGDENGFFGSARYPLTPFVQLYASADFSVYSFNDLADEEQTAAQAGIRLAPLKTLQVDASLQGLVNNQFDQDIRGLLRVKWSFSN